MPTRLDEVPTEVLQRILSYVAAESTSRAAVELSLVSRKFADASHLHTVQLSSVMSARSFAEVVATSRATAQRVRRLTFDAQDPPSSRETGRRKRSSAISADQIGRACDGLRYLEVLVLRSVDLSALRRRQLGFTASLAHLHTLVVASPSRQKGASTPAHLNLHTLGSLVNALPTLRHLYVRGLRGSSASLRGLTPPSCRLVSLALYDLIEITSAQLAWLLASATQADSLRQFAFELGETARPAQWSAIKWALLPVSELYVTSTCANAIEKVPQHFPSLEAYHFCARTPINLDCLMASMASLPTQRRIRLYDYSSAAGGTTDLYSVSQSSRAQHRDDGTELSAKSRTSPKSRFAPALAPSPPSLDVPCPTRRSRTSAVLSWPLQLEQDEPIVPKRFADLIST